MEKRMDVPQKEYGERKVLILSLPNKILLGVFAVFVLIATAQVLLVTDSRWIHLAALMLLGSTFGSFVSLMFDVKSRIAVFFAILTFSLVWGTSIFRSYIYYDELGRASYSSLNPMTWLMPINDHFQPLMYPIWWFQHNEVFRGSYLPISSFFYLTAIAGIAAIFYVSKKLVEELGMRQSLTVAFIAAVPMHNPDLWWWKGAGDAPVLSLSRPYFFG